MAQRTPLLTRIHPLGRVSLLLLMAYVALVSLIYVVQRRMIYFPDPTPPPTPDGSRFHGFESVELKTRDGHAIHGWYWPGTAEAVIVFFHGNGGNRWHRLGWMEAMHQRGVGVFIIDYRGYGGSQGYPSEKGLYADGEAALAWIRERHSGPLIYYGESLGTGVATEMARRHPPAGLILESGFPRLAEVAARSYSFLPINLLLKDRFDNLAKLPKIKVPVLVFHGANDGIVPAELGRKLFDAANEPKQWALMKDAGHNNVPFADEIAYFTAMERFLKKL